MDGRCFYNVHSWNLSLSEGNRVVVRKNWEGSGIVYMTEELGVDEACSLRVEAVDAGREGRPQALSLKLGLTTCDSSIVDNFPSHVIEPCQPSHDCMGQTMTINVRSANLVDDEIRMQRKAGGVLQVFVNDVQEFSLTDPHDSIFPLSKGDAYPFLMLSGSVSKIRSIESGGISVIPNDSSVGGDCVVSKNRQRVDSCCVICMDKMISHMAVPCNHAAFCDFDANEHLKNSKVCPVCRKGVTNFEISGSLLQNGGLCNNKQHEALSKQGPCDRRDQCAASECGNCRRGKWADHSQAIKHHPRAPHHAVHKPGFTTPFHAFA